MSTKLTAHQNKQITEALCRMVEDQGFAFDEKYADVLTKARRALVRECEEVNVATSSVALSNLRSDQ